MDVILLSQSQATVEKHAVEIAKSAARGATSLPGLYTCSEALLAISKRFKLAWANPLR